MKKKAPGRFYILFWVLAIVFAISLPECFKDSAGTGITCLVFVILFAVLGYLNFTAGKRIAARERQAKLDQLRKKNAEAKKMQEAEEKRRQYISVQQRAFAAELNSIPKAAVTVSAHKAKRQPAYQFECHYTNITRSTVIDKLFPFVVVDVETTGLKPANNDIIEVSAIRYEKGFRPVSCFTTLLKPRNPIPEDATRVNHITDEMVEGKPGFSEIAESFSEYISGCNLVGHNLSFDLKFLYACGAALPENNRLYDTLTLAKYTLRSPGTQMWDNEAKEYYYPDTYDVENYKLGTLCEYYGIYSSAAHRSLADCYATAQLFERLIETKRSDPEDEL